MIVCHPLKLIFVKTKKVGGTSFEIALSKYCSEKCIITEILPEDEQLRQDLGFQPAQNFCPDLDLRFKFWDANFRMQGHFTNHMTSQEIRDQVPNRIWKKYRRVAIYRDPFDCIASTYFWNTKNQRRRKTFHDWFFKDPSLIQDNIKIAPLSGELKVDCVIQYEKLEQGIEQLGIEGFNDVFSNIQSKGNIRPKKNSKYIHLVGDNTEITAMISELSREEIEYFGYEIP